MKTPPLHPNDTTSTYRGVPLAQNGTSQTTTEAAAATATANEKAEGKGKGTRKEEKTTPRMVRRFGLRVRRWIGRRYARATGSSEVGGWEESVELGGSEAFERER